MGGLGSTTGIAGAVLAQLEKWRDRGEREASSRAAAFAAVRVFDPNVGDPSPELSSAAAPDFGALAPIPSALWARLSAVLRRAATRIEMQPGLCGSPAANVWIVKPSGKSRGRGIACETSLARVLARRSAEAGATKATGGGGFIVQKYCERPLLIRDCKFDVRQWVLVTSWAPLQAWAFARPYLRFCAVPFSLEPHNIADRYAHLSNNSVQKHCAAFGGVGDQNMWHAADFAAWLQVQAAEGAWVGLEYEAGEAAAAAAGDVGFDKSEEGEGGGGGSNGSNSPSNPGLRLPVNECSDIWNQVIAPRIRRVLLHTLLCGRELLGSKSDAALCFEQYGFDLMVDATLRVWLIEVNSAPDMSHSTRVTAALVPPASDGMAAVLCEWAEWSRGCKKGAAPPTGGWEMLYCAPDAADAAPSCLAVGLALVGKTYGPPPPKNVKNSNTNHTNIMTGGKPPAGPLHTNHTNIMTVGKPPAGPLRTAAAATVRTVAAAGAGTPPVIATQEQQQRASAIVATATLNLNLNRLPRVAMLSAATTGFAARRAVSAASGAGVRAVRLLGTATAGTTTLQLTMATVDFAPPPPLRRDTLLRSASAGKKGGGA